MILDERYKFIPPGGESWQQMELRLQKAINIIISQPYSAICIVTHGGALRGLIPLLKRSRKEESFKYNFKNASITIFDYDGDKNKFIESTINYTQHLDT